MSDKQSRSHSQPVPHATGGRQTQWTERDVEKLLTAFFQDEMPAELRDRPDSDLAEGPQRVSLGRVDSGRTDSGRLSPRAGRPAQWASVALLVSCVTVLVLALSLSQRPQPVDQMAGDADGTASRRSDSARDAEQNQDQDLDAPLPLVSLQVDRYRTEVGVVEQRTHVQWNSVSVYEAGRGVEVAWSVPEISIEVYGVPESSPRN